MAAKIAFYEMPASPDPGDASLGTAEARPREAMWTAMTHLCRFLSGLDAGAATVCVRLIFSPGESDPQARLRVYLATRTEGKTLGNALAALVTGGSWGLFFKLQPTNEPALPPELAAGCHLFRAHKRHVPLVSADLHAGVPESYLSCFPFVANEQNDWASLDRLLDGVEEPVVIDVAVQPTETARLRESHSRYLAQLQRFSRAWNIQDDMILTQDPLGDEPQSRDDHLLLTPLRRADPTAQLVQQEQQGMQEFLGQPQLRYHAVVLARTEETARLVGSTLAEGAFLEGSYELCVHADSNSIQSIQRQLSRLETLDPETVKPMNKHGADPSFPDLWLLPHVASLDELAGLFRFPIASCGSPRCLRRNTDPRPLGTGASVLFGWDATSGHPSARVSRGIPSQALCRHVFAAGTTGSGKTTMLLNLILQLWRQRIPVIVFEPVKTEFRVLKRLGDDPREELSRLGRDLEIYTPGSEDLSPLRFNPLELSPGITALEQMDAVMTCFQASITMSGPLPALLCEAIEEVYDTEEQPTIQSLFRAVERALARKRYSASTQADLRGALDTRLGSLLRGNIGRVVQCTRSLPTIERIMNSPTVIEMDRLSQEHACLLTLLVLVRLRQAVRTPAKTACHPRLVVIIDEAHNFVGPDTKAEPSEDNPRATAYASQFICRMLAEMRARGVAVIISDQTPSAVAAEVVKLPTTKLAFQQTDKDDREVIGSAMLFKNKELEDVARLQAGEAYLFTSGFHGPHKIRTENLHEQMDLRPLTDQELHGIICAEPWHVEMTEARLQTELGVLAKCMDAFDTQRIVCAAEVARLCARLPQALGVGDPLRRRQSLADIQKKAMILKERLGEAYRRFRLRDYGRLMPSVGTMTTVGVELNQLRSDLATRYETVIRGDTQQCLGILERVIKNCGGQ